MILDLPPIPEEAERSSGVVPIRYEDVAEDGGLRIEALPVSLGPAIWRHLTERPAAKALTAAGVVPILSRMRLISGDGPISAVRDLHADGRWALAHEPRGTGKDRLFLNMWSEVRGVRDQTWGSPSGAGAPLVVGRMFAEHTLTRLFAPPGSRRVTSLDRSSSGGAGHPEIPGEPYSPGSPEDLLGASPDALPPAGDVRFGLDDTDANRHVNSLVYLRVFREAALRALGPEVALRRASALEISWRKPCFAGETYGLRVLASGDSAAATLVGADGAMHAMARVRF